MYKKLLFFAAVVIPIFSLSIIVVHATSESVTVQIEATDGLMLAGDYYAQQSGTTPETGSPAVLLMHEFGADRSVWLPIIDPLLEAGYHVLNMDLRGHGATQGEIDWRLATTDVQTVLTWLRTQSDVKADDVSIIGASIGADLALIGCGKDPDCVTAVALSPGKVGCNVIDCSQDVFYVGQDAVDYLGGEISIALTENLKSRSALLMVSQSDDGIMDSVRQMILIAKGEIGLRIYKYFDHGTELISNISIGNKTILNIINWLNEHV